MAPITSSEPTELQRPLHGRKLFGRAFYESIGSPKMIVAPMVDRSEFAWRMLTRSYMDDVSSKSLLAYTPMLHARLFKENAKFRDGHFQPTKDSLALSEKPSSAAYLDGNPSIDRPLFVQFCANQPDDLYEAAQYVAPYCDAVDLNLGCPQGIARSGHYGAFLQENWDIIYKLVNKLHRDLPVPVTAKMRILETREKTLRYAKMILSAGASILTVHGRRREQKSHNTGIADWAMIRYLRDNLPQDTVIFANGNILNHSDLQPCLDSTGADGIMSAEGNLSDPTIFAKPPAQGQDEREYWRGPDGQEGHRLDGVIRRYLDIIYKYVLDLSPPVRPPLYVLGDLPLPPVSDIQTSEESDEPPKKRRKKEQSTKMASPNLRPMQGHLFQLLRPMISTFTEIRDALAKCQAGDMPAFERVLRMIEDATARALQDDAEKDKASLHQESNIEGVRVPADHKLPSSKAALAKYRRPWYICQPYIRPLPEEALEKGALQMSKKAKKAQGESQATSFQDDPVVRIDEHTDVEKQHVDGARPSLPNAALVCG